MASIEEVRSGLYKLVSLKGLRHPDVLDMSQYLDELLNQYEQGRESTERVNS
ncbi:MAG: aspartyl-phosphate phosphatase Spo0E family protein [Sporomusaceae bacterium]|nr:aspartyl-phosphate phosphatase Spo0E family protein [Sporomusaceae bacterium]